MVKHRNAGDPSSNLGGPITFTKKHIYEKEYSIHIHILKKVWRKRHGN